MAKLFFFSFFFCVLIKSSGINVYPRRCVTRNWIVISIPESVESRESPADTHICEYLSQERVAHDTISKIVEQATISFLWQPHK